MSKNKSVFPTHENGQEKQKDFEPLYFWMSISMDLMTIDEVSENFTVRCFVKIFWEPDLSNICIQGPCDMIINGEDIEEGVLYEDFRILPQFNHKEDEASGEVKNAIGKKKITVDASMTCPLNPELIFLNSFEETFFSVNRLCLKNGVIFLQLHKTVSIYADFDMHRYPFDKHLLPLVPSIRNWESRQEDGKSKKYKWVLMKTNSEKFEIAHKLYEEDEVICSDIGLHTNTLGQFKQQQSWYVNEKKGKATIYIRIVREISYFMFNVVVPLFPIVLTAMATFLMPDGESIADYLSINLVTLLTIVAFKFAVSQGIPTQGCVSYADWYFVSSILFTLFAMVVNICQAFELKVAIVLKVLAVSLFTMLHLILLLGYKFIPSCLSNSWENTLDHAIQTVKSSPAKAQVQVPGNLKP